MTDYFIPEKHIQMRDIANTPIWLREHFKEQGRKEVLDETLKILGRISQWIDNNAMKDYGEIYIHYKDIKDLIRKEELAIVEELRGLKDD